MNILIINRWSDDFADYFSLINHSLYNVIYITNKNGSKYLVEKNGYKMHFEIEDLTSKTSLEECIDKSIEKLGKIGRIIAMSEYDMLIAGYLRTKYKIIGMNYQTALNFVDKTHMKNSLNGSNIRCPKFINDLSLIDTFCESAKFPLVLKPKIGASSKGVLIANNLGELSNLIESLDNKELYECEEYISGPIFHIDGVVFEDEIMFIKSSKYLNTCLDYEHGKPLGSIVISDNNIQMRFKSFAEKVLSSLGLETGIFHLEAILSDGELVFLEVGARQGGGEIVPEMKHLYGVDLIEIFFKTQMLLPFNLSENKTTKVGGFLLFPEPKDVPCRVISYKSMKHLKSLVYEIIPDRGTVLTGTGGYYFNAGRFLFSGKEEQVLSDLHNAIKTFHITTQKSTGEN